MKRLFNIVLAGNPNCGKTALFNTMTGGRARVGNYSGVTVERKEGVIQLAAGIKARLLDLPGIYSLEGRTIDEKISRDVLLGLHPQEKEPDLIIAVVDSIQLERSLGFVLELSALGKPMILTLNMMDLAKKRGFILDFEILSRELGIPVIPTIAIRKGGARLLLEQIKTFMAASKPPSSLDPQDPLPPEPTQVKLLPTQEEIRNRFIQVDRILNLAVHPSPQPFVWTDRIDRIVLHPLWGSLCLCLILGLVFQSIFTLALIPMDWIKLGISFLGQGIEGCLSEGPLRSLLIDGILAGVGSVLVFLPQILILFSFILFLEDSGYLPRAAFLMDRLMGRVGLHGRAFIPLLSSVACAIPGIMATRTIVNRRDRLTTILIAPLMTCSARLPVYSLLIGAFIPNRLIWGWIRLQALVIFGLYGAGLAAALAMAVVFRATLLKGPIPPLLMELPHYKWPRFKNIFIGLLERAQLFVTQAGTVILSISIVLWFLASYPKPPLGSPPPAIASSYAGQLGHWLEPLVKPIGFNWKIAVALIPGFVAREVMVGSLATVYAVDQKEQEKIPILGDILAKEWSVATGLSLLIWYVLACQCLSTLAVTRRETQSWFWPGVMLTYMTLLAYLGSWITFQIAVKWGLG